MWEFRLYLVATVLDVSLEVLQYHLGDAYKLPVTTVKINQANLIKCAAIIVRFSFRNNWNVIKVWSGFYFITSYFLDYREKFEIL